MSLEFHYEEMCTKNVWLRKPLIADAAELCLLRSDDQVNTFLDRPKTVSVQDCEKTLEKIIHGIDIGESAYWILRDTHTDQLMGTACIWNLNKAAQTAELGCEMFPEFQGKGLMYEVLNAVIEFAKNNTQLNYLEAYTHHQHTKSQNLLHRLNFVHSAESLRESGILDWVFKLEL